MRNSILIATMALFGCPDTSNTPENPCTSQECEDAGVQQDSGTNTDSGIDNPTDSGVISDSGVDSGSVCGEVEVKTEPVVPTVVVILDQSGSMNDPFVGTTSRWQALRNYMLSPTGLFGTYQDTVNFGIVMYSRTGVHNETCPFVSQVAPSISNFNTIYEAYSQAEPLNDTPTGESISKLLAENTFPNPSVFILATDGEPDTCAQPMEEQGQAEAVAAVTEAYNLGITTYVLAVANEEELSQTHVNDLANAGQGVTEGAQSYRVSNDTGIREALTEIISGSISCLVNLKGTVTTEDTCQGTVTLNGTKLSCGKPDGWELVDNNKIQLMGEACAELKKGSLLTAAFPCKAVSVH